ncbi:trimeric intracellular cation channel family protein [Sulfurimonas sp.]|uniref:trimeric intracellular cation channel family protein n=1 Tax=Sulfurimonas sp. TaxID=2022749 RepID=UPI00356482B5
MFELAEYIGIVAFAMSGFFIASRANLDLLGVLISTFLTALGGGIIRDISVGTTPFTFTHDYPGIIVLSVMIIMILFKFHKRNSIENKPYFILSDSIGLISFSISGALIAIEYNLNFTGVLAISFITAVGGGIVRDVIINEVPFVFKSGFYGTIALLIATIIFILNALNYVNIFTLSILFVFGVALRLVAFYKKWSIPLK